MAIGSTLENQRLYVSLLLWGREGTGKTTDALRLTQCGKGKVVLINAEGGAKKKPLADQGIDTSRVEIWPPDEQGPGYITFDTIHDEVIVPLREALTENPDSYIGIVIDSFTEVARRTLEQAAADSLIKAQRLGKSRDRWQTTLEDHGTSASMMRALLRELRDLPCHLVITALERRDVDQNTGVVVYGPAMGPAVGTDTMGLVDLVGFCQVEEIGTETFRTATFTPTPLRRAKDRFGAMPVKLADPFADRIVGYITGDLDRSNDPVRARVIAAAQALEGEVAGVLQTQPLAAEAAEETSAEEPATDTSAA